MCQIIGRNDYDLDQRLAGLKAVKPNGLYYAITLTADADGKVTFGTQTEWVGWTDESKREELRRARRVFPKFASLWDELRQPYAVVNTTDEIVLFLLGGGNALVEEKLGKRLFPYFLAPGPSVPYGKSGFASPELLQKTAFRRTPTPKIRMQVLNRDRRRCRICGRNPDDHLDLVLHVHHIRPWERGGITDPNNLITLCQTCHLGLNPHYDPSLHNYLRRNSADPIEENLNEFLVGVANYRKVGFFSSIRAAN